MQPGIQIAVNATQLDAMARRLKAQGFGPEALKSGTLPETSGVVLSYSVTPVGDGAMVSFTVVKKPFFVSVGMIQSELQKQMFAA